MNSPYLPRPIDLPTAVPLDPAADLSILDEAKIFAAPDDPSDWPAWRDQLARWRRDARRRVSYDGWRYDTSSGDCFSVCLAWLWDETLYDHDRGEFTVDSFVDSGDRDFGGFDGVVLWHAYPVIGLDARNQFDYYRQVTELPEVVAAFHRRGVKVFVCHYPWEPSEPKAMADVVEWLAADGVFLDSAREGPTELRALLPDGVVLEGESRVPLARIHDHEMSWAQWFADSTVPGVLRAKWFERRHLLHHVRRWHRSHVDELHSAWLNGCGVVVWENVFGVWVGWNERDRALLRAMRPIQRDYAAWLRAEDWTPLADHPGGGAPVYASRWVHRDTPLWTVVNRGGTYDGPWLAVDARPGTRFVELTTGTELDPAVRPDGRVVLSGSLPEGGIAAVTTGAVASTTATAAPAGSAGAAAPTTRRPATANTSFPARAAIRRRPPVARRDAVPPGMVVVDGGRYDLTVHYRQRETGLYGEAPFVDEWKPLPPRLHAEATLRRTVHLERFAIATLEVPLEENELVDLAGARAYAARRGLRLPTEDEWQVAAEAGLLDYREPRVWNLTESEHSDGRTRFVILKGGCAFRAEGSDWYLDGGPQPPDVSVKLLLLGNDLTRSPSLGFRVAADLP